MIIKKTFHDNQNQITYKLLIYDITIVLSSNINNIDTNIKSGIININSLLTGNNHIELKSGTVNLNLKGDDYRFKTTRISGIISINEERET